MSQEVAETKMRFVMVVSLNLSKPLPSETPLPEWIKEAESLLIKGAADPKEGARAELLGTEKNGSALLMKIESGRRVRPHHALQRLRKHLSKKLGTEYHVGIRGAEVLSYEAYIDLEKPPKKSISLPFVRGEIMPGETHVKLVFNTASVKSEGGNEGKGEELTITLEALEDNIPDRVIKRLKEKVEEQYYEGKGEFWELVWQSPQREHHFSKDPTEEMLKRGWVVQGPTKGKWFLRPQAAAVLRAMEKIALEEVLYPLGFKEVISSHIVDFNVWLKTGHLEGMPGEIYYVCEPRTRDTSEWEMFRDVVHITRRVPLETLKKMLSPPKAGITYAQCPNIYWSFQGRTISEESLPVKIFERAANSNRYESGGRHGLERVDEFHRIEPVYIGTPEQLAALKEELTKRYTHVFEDILELEWRMAWVTPFYMAQAGQVGIEDEQKKVKGTMDFEAYMPYRGGRDTQWLEFQNLSVLGDKYIKAFNIKAQRSTLWSGCSGIGLERWAMSFLAQKGLEPEGWPEGFKRYLPEIPEGIRFL